MEWYLKVVRDNYANFEGRARRKEYWMFVLFNILFAIATGIVGVILAKITGIEILAVVFYAIYILAIIIPSIAVGVRRLHDTNKSGWLYLISLIPFVGGIILLVFFVTEGTQGDNDFGSDPKEIEEF